MPVVNLTSTYVEGLRKRPPLTGRIEVWDERIPGLCLRLSSTGAGSWTFRYRPRDGAGYQRVTLGSLADLTLADARDRAARHRIQVSDGADPQRERQEKRAAAANRLTFDRLAERYLDEYAKPRKASWRNDEGYLRRPRDRWGDQDAQTITRRDVIGLLDEIKATAPVSANRTHSVLVTLFNWAVEDELLEINPAAGLKKRAPETPSDRTLSETEIRVLWRAIETTDEALPDVKAALKAILLTGQRPGEVAGASQREIIALDDPKKARWEIPADRMKARRPHVVPLAPMARSLFAEALARRKAEDDRAAVFASRYQSRETLARHSLSQALRRVLANHPAAEGEEEALESLRADPPTPHDFRRTVASGMAALGVPREDRLALLAHVPGDVHGAVYDRYERLREKRIALEAWERHVAQVLGAKLASAAVVPITRRSA